MPEAIDDLREPSPQEPIERERNDPPNPAVIVLAIVITAIAILTALVIVSYDRSSECVVDVARMAALAGDLHG